MGWLLLTVRPGSCCPLLLFSDVNKRSDYHLPCTLLFISLLGPGTEHGTSPLMQRVL